MYLLYFLLMFKEEFKDLMRIKKNWGETNKQTKRTHTKTTLYQFKIEIIWMKLNLNTSCLLPRLAFCKCSWLLVEIDSLFLKKTNQTNKNTAEVEKDLFLTNSACF